MTINQAERFEVYASLKATNGERVAGLVLEMLPPAGVPELATKADLAVLEAKFDGKFDGLRAEFNGEFNALRAEFGEFKAQMLAAFEAQTTRYVRWNLTINGALVAVVGAIVGAIAALA
ncbi:MAG: hypothetical protein HYU28_00050 [Actinobacteria bacterium]|nr:hypothetical protein [Actinomycetota bacterium]